MANTNFSQLSMIDPAHRGIFVEKGIEWVYLQIFLYSFFLFWIFTYLFYHFFKW